MKFKFLGILGSLLLSIGCFAQNTTVTATVVDGDSVAWANATWTIDFVPSTQFPTPSQYTVNGAPLSSSVTHQTGSLSNIGALSVVVYDSSLVSPIGSGWRLALCPITSGSCITYQFSTAGGAQNISTNLTTTIGQPRFACTTICHGYSTIEAIPQIGAVFTNSISTGNNIWNGTTWVSTPVNICHISTPIAQTGNTSTHTLFTCTIPPNALSVNSRLEVRYLANGTVGNTGNCASDMRYGLTGSGADGDLGNDGGIAANGMGLLVSVIAERGVLNSQIAHGLDFRNGGISGNTLLVATVTSSSTQFIIFTLANGVSADTCNLQNVDVVLWQ